MLNETAIGLFCYKRAGKLTEVLSALLKNIECRDLDIIFFADGYKGESDKMEVEETRSVINSVTGFKNVYKHFRERNYSTGPNFATGITFLCESYKQFIIVEDDLVVTPNYLCYMLAALEYYKNNPSVFCITGFCFPMQAEHYPYDTVVHRRFCSYGWASWSNEVSHVKWYKDDLINLIETTPSLRESLNKEGRDLFRMLKKQVSGKISTWDIQMQVHVAINKLKVIYPIKAKAKNIGFGKEATNTFGVDYLKTPQDESGRRFFNFCPFYVEEPRLQLQLRRPYSLPSLTKRKIINTAIKFFKL